MTLRIAHVLTLLSADGSYGGPLSVAVGQCAELARRGHGVTLLTGWDGRAPVPAAGFSALRFRVRRLLPGSGFGPLTSVALALHLARHAREWDVVHVHLARELVVVPAALVCLWRGVPLVVQTHGMIVPDRRLRCWILDAVAIRPILRAARAHLVLSDTERTQVLAVAPARSNIATLANGIVPTALRARPAGCVVPEVLFCARLHPSKRVLAFAEMAALLTGRGIRARFTVLGPDEGDLAELRCRMADPTLAGALTYAGALDPAAVRARLAAGQVFVQPSQAESFGMTVLEAWSVGLPVVLTESVGLAPVLATVDPGLVVSGTAASLARAVEGLLTDPRVWEAASSRARSLAADQFGIAAVVTSLERIYDRSVSAVSCGSGSVAAATPR